MTRQYRNILNDMLCSRCRSRDTCFLRKVPLQRYPEQVQEFVVKMPKTIFLYNAQDKLWHADYKGIQDQLVKYYNLHNCEFVGNQKSFLRYEAQKDNDRQMVRENFKLFLEMASKATEYKNPEISIMFDGIGLLLASDYLEAVNKILSMLKTASKLEFLFNQECWGY